METWAMPYSSMYQPIALTALRVPGMLLGGSPRPLSRTSNATALARRVDVVLRLTLKATRKSRAPITVAPERGLNSAGPKSGFQAGSASLVGSASYSPERITDRFFRAGSGWDASYR